MPEHDNHPHVEFTPDIGSQASGSRPTTLQMFSALKWPIFPVNSTRENGECTCGRIDCPNKGKHPRVTGWPEQATTDTIQHAKWKKLWPSTNWALACGQESGVWVLDVDEKNGGYESLAKLEFEIGELPKTVRVKTGGGGLHIYFAWPTDGTIITNAVNLKGAYPGLDVRGHRGYVVIPPGKHKSGNRYGWLQGFCPDEVPLVQAPQALIDLVSSPAPMSSLKQFSDNGEPWEDMGVDDADRIAEQECGWIVHGKSKECADAVSEPEWAVMLATARSLHGTDDGLAQLWSKNYSTYSDGVVRKKWNDHGYKGIPSCAYIQSQFAPKACQTCPFRDAGKSPGYHIRKARARELGLKGLWGAPKTTDDKSIGHTKNNCETAQSEVGEERMEAQLDGNAVIDVTEDDWEGDSDFTADAGQAQAGDAGTGNGPNFRVIHNISDLVAEVKALCAELEGGGDQVDMKRRFVKVLILLWDIDQKACKDECERVALTDSRSCKALKRTQYYKTKMLLEAIAEERQREILEEINRQWTVGEKWPDAPTDLHEVWLPIGHRYSEMNVQRFEERAFELVPSIVASQPIFVGGINKDMTSGEISLDLWVFTPDEGWVVRAVSPKIIEDRKQIGELREHGFLFPDSGEFAKYVNTAYELVYNGQKLRPKKGSPTLGWHGSVFVTEAQCIGDGEQIRHVPIGGHKRGVFKWQECSEEEWKQLAEKVFTDIWTIYDPLRMALINGWWVASLFAPKFREHLSPSKTQFPIMELYGIHGSGKSTIMSIVQRLTTGTDRTYSARANTFVKMLPAASQNAFPLVYDEYKPHQMSKYQLDETNTFLRESYNMDTQARGSRNLKLHEYPLLAPIAVLGEAPFTEGAVVERSVMVHMDKRYTMEKQYQESLRKFSALPLERFAGGFIQWVVKQYRINMVFLIELSIEKALEEVEKFEDKMSDEGKTTLLPRPRVALATVYAGLQLWQAFAEMLGISLPNEARPSISDLRTTLLDGANGGEKETLSDLDKLMHDTVAMLTNPRYSPEVVRCVEGDEIRLVMTHWVNCLHKYNRDRGKDGDSLDGSVIRDLLRQDVESSGYVVAFGKPSKTPAGTQRCVILSAKALHAKLEIEAELFIIPVSEI